MAHELDLDLIKEYGFIEDDIEDDIEEVELNIKQENIQKIYEATRWMFEDISKEFKIV